LTEKRREKVKYRFISIIAVERKKSFELCQIQQPSLSLFLLLLNSIEREKR
jgi:hypothetical protein